MRKILLILSILLLTACEPTVFDVPKSTWDTLTPEQKQQVIDGYNQRKQIETQNAPLQSAIDTAGFVLQNQNK